MARPIEANKPGPKKNAVLSIRVSWDTYDKIKAVADKRHITVTDIVTEAILKEIGKEISK